MGNSDLAGGELFIQEECGLIFYWVGYFFKFPPPKVTNIFSDIFLVVYLHMHKIYMKEKSLAFSWKKKKKKLKELRQSIKELSLLPHWIKQYIFCSLATFKYLFLARESLVYEETQY